MPSIEAVQGASVPLRELRPELDLALLQPYELAQFYTLRERAMIQPISVREDGLRPISSQEPAPLSPVSADAPAPSDEPSAEAPVCLAADPERQTERDSGDLSRLTENEAASRREASEACPAAGASATAEVEPKEADALPYGADPVRIRELVEWIVTGREIVPVTFHYRQAGDLLDPQAPPGRPLVSARQVAAVYKAS